MTTKSRKFYIQLFIMLLIFIIFNFLPPFGVITPKGMQVLGIFLGCIFAWMTGELLWSSLLGLIALTVLGFGTMPANYSAAFGNGTTGLTIASFVFCFGIEKCGLLQEIARWIVCRKWAQKDPWTLAGAFFVAAATIAALATVAAPAIVIIWALWYEVSKELDIKPYDHYGSFVLIGVAVIACGGCIVMPYSSMAVLTQGIAQTSYPDFLFNNLKYLLINTIIILGAIILVVLLFKYIIRPQITFKLHSRDAYKIKFDSKMKITLCYLLLVAILLIVPNILSATNPLHIFFSGTLGTLGVLISVSILMMITRIDGKPLMDIESALREGVPWSLVFLVSAALAISNYLVADEMGIVATITNLLQPVLTGHSAVMILVLFLAVTLLMTNLINDIVTATVLFPIGAKFFLEAGGNLELFAILFVPAMIQGCFMPSGSIVGALMHGNQAWLNSKDVFKLVAIMEVCILIIITLVSLGSSILGI